MYFLYCQVTASLHNYTVTRNTAKFYWNIHTNDDSFNVIQNCFSYQLSIHIVWDSNANKFEMLYTFHDDRVVSKISVEGYILQEGWGSSPWSSWSVYLHFVWGGPGLQLLKECLHVSLLWTARQEFCQSGIVHILMGETVNGESSVSSKKESRLKGGPWGIPAVI